jgi:hypothetical protein
MPKIVDRGQIQPLLPCQFQCTWTSRAPFPVCVPIRGAQSLPDALQYTLADVQLRSLLHLRLPWCCQLQRLDMSCDESYLISRYAELLHRVHALRRKSFVNLGFNVSRHDTCNNRAADLKQINIIKRQSAVFQGCWNRKDGTNPHDSRCDTYRNVQYHSARMTGQTNLRRLS